MVGGVLVPCLFSGDREALPLSRATGLAPGELSTLLLSFEGEQTSFISTSPPSPMSDFSMAAISFVSYILPWETSLSV